MAAILVLFTLGLIVLHVVTTSNSKRIERIKKRIMRLLSVTQDLEYLRGRIYELLDPNGEVRSLREIRGIQSNRGAMAMTIVVGEVSDEQKELLRMIILRDEWYLSHIRSKLKARSSDWAGVFTKLVAELQLSVFEEEVCANLRRWPRQADNQEIGLLALFLCGSRDRLLGLFSDPDFHLILSFRSLQELFACYAGDHVELCRELLNKGDDVYITRACIREIGNVGAEELCPSLLPYLEAENANLLIDAVRSLGKLRYLPAGERIRQLTGHEAWSVRSTAATALAQVCPENCYDDLLRCLCDREWWVRFHAAEALCALPGHDCLMADAEALGDRYAFEMMRYIMERNELLSKEAPAC